MGARLGSLLAILVCGVALAAERTATSIQHLDSTHTFVMGGTHFLALTSAVETARPPGGGMAPAVIGPLVEGTDYILDPNSGTISAAPGRAAYWAALTWTYDDQAEAQATATAEADEAAADCDIARPALKTALIQDLQDLDQEETRTTQIYDQMLAQIAAQAADPTLPASPTAAQLRAAIVTLATRDAERTQALRDAALGAQRNIDRTRGLIRLVACQAGIPDPTQH
jgi:hypothetical protein